MFDIVKTERHGWNTRWQADLLEELDSRIQVACDEIEDLGHDKDTVDLLRNYVPSLQNQFTSTMREDASNRQHVGSIVYQGCSIIEHTYSDEKVMMELKSKPLQRIATNPLRIWDL